ncbi:Demethylmenaquinone methyltransferase [Maioricimonas rarisocia]|uniref:Demethylmenaquinone methyltransferase n=1 Tax=Maioricimonas rarisocia TaxID=2528026 RepID=A0A517Z855_9PLAN|nr:methyltransferase domain-containing protein [Maioricimonas rarisocia]QDU38643.1 Demethylmenaquinone methyltransferase [Maioricimonas rarisocia]
MTNAWNRRIYSVWAPVYDLLIRSPPFAQGRQAAIDMLELAPHETVLLLGVGTGADLPLLEGHTRWFGIDLTRAMLERARRRTDFSGPSRLVQADAARLPFANGSFDAAVANLILSVVPDGRRCLEELCRVVRPGGRIVVFDKFAPDDGAVPVIRRLINPLTQFFGTDVTRRLADLTRDLPLQRQRPACQLAGGAFSACRLDLIGNTR